MKPVMQTIFGGGPARGEPPGNCLQAAIASLLELPLEAVPHVLADGDEGPWYENLQAWARRELGMDFLTFPEHAIPVPAGYHLISGTSPRGVTHTAVGFNGRVVHDPHPEGGELKAPLDCAVFVPLDPAAASRAARGT